MKELNIATQSGTVLHGVLFPAETPAKTVVIAITGIHGNFYSNPFYYNIGETLSKAGVDFLYAQTRNAFGKMQEVFIRRNRRFQACRFQCRISICLPLNAPRPCR